MENGFITVYHGTHDKFVGDIKRGGLKAGNMGYDNSVWYMVSTDMDSALYHSTPSGEIAYVFEFEIPVNNSKWEGYPYFWPPYNRKPGSKWFALKQELPPKFIKKIHKVKKDKYTDSKNNGLNEEVRRGVNEDKIMEIRNMIRKVILESIEIDDIDNKTKLEVFDFDGTLVNTPTPTEDNKDIWKNKTGKNWEGGWFGNKDSLNMDVFDMPVIPSVISDYNKSDADPSILKVMLTGRIKKMDKYVRAVLDSKGLKFDDYLYNEGGDTEKEKIRHMEAILKYNPNIREVIIHDDRDPHIPIFQAWGDSMIDKGHLDAFSINHIPGFRHL